MYVRNHRSVPDERFPTGPMRRRGAANIAQRDFRVGTHWNGDLAVLSVSGELDVFTASVCEAGVDVILSALPAGVVVDLTELTFVDAAGSRPLRRLLRHSARAGSAPVLVCYTPFVISTLRLLGFGKHLAGSSEGYRGSRVRTSRWAERRVPAPRAG